MLFRSSLKRLVHFIHDNKQPQAAQMFSVTEEAKLCKVVYEIDVLPRKIIVFNQLF